eukprot:TRINITY_DN19609_c0_g1_i1.p1 TRINITY_DN19609_c0_g1~~TRINITY_DN19609_c0_g1_i1.p1  ORF type:complete len:371 (+),score=60.50 TRINITY_DN19609_c0_g1_i1:110-1222(+)
MDPEDRENAHFLDVCYSFLDYRRTDFTRLWAAKRALESLDPEDLSLWNFQAQPWLTQCGACIEGNQRFLNHIVSCFPGRPGVERMPRSIPAGHFVEERNSSKACSTLKQFVRDWALEGEKERRMCYTPLIEALCKYLPLPAVWKPEDPWTKVLCPGSGLGRLPFEVSKLGYSAQGNEFSYHMILGSFWALNVCHPSEAWRIFPFATSLANRRGKQDHVIPVMVPDVCPGTVLTDQHQIGFCAGDFVEVYGRQTAAWDALLTPFFIDTAKNIYIYIRTIANILKPGGLWTNLGPLLFHYADMPDEPSIELSWEEIRPGICRYFDIKEERTCNAMYTAHPSGMSRTWYTCIFFAAIRNSTPAEGYSKPVYDD